MYISGLTTTTTTNRNKTNNTNTTNTTTNKNLTCDLFTESRRFSRQKLEYGGQDKNTTDNGTVNW